MTVINGETAYEKYIRILESFKGVMARDTFRARVIGRLCTQCPAHVKWAVDEAEKTTEEEWGHGIS